MSGWNMSGEYRFPRPSAPLAVLVVVLALGPAHAGNADYVDPFIGTAAGSQPYAKGNTFPGALVPNGMVAISPDTSPRYSGGYRSGASYIEGFSQNHMSGVGCSGDLGNILLMPTVGVVRTTEAGYRSTYNSEAAQPGYYRTFLATPGVTAEMSATTRASISRYTFPARPGGDANILLDVSHGLTASRGGTVAIVSAKEVEGYNDTGGFCGTSSPYKVYFVARFSKSSAARGTWSGAAIGPATQQTGPDIGAYFRFATAAGEKIEVRLGVSYVSIANARANLDAEIPDTKSFDQVRADALARWNADLGRVDVAGGTPAQRTMFYTALYHALIHPSVNSDVNGQYQGMGGAGVRTASGYTHHHLFSLWDTYRSLHPLLSLLYPARQADMVRSMLAMYQESGWLPKWEFVGRETRIMVGDPAAVVIADTYLKGIRNFDIATAYAAMKKSATTTAGNPIRPCLDRYLKLRYLPHDGCTGSVSVTEEYGYADHATAKLAEALGNSGDAAAFKARSLYYRNLFDRGTGFLRPRYADGAWLAPFDPLCCALGSGKYQGPGYIEGTAWQYLFMVPHDIAGLKALLGGDMAFVAKLNAAFTDAGGYYTLINEPDVHYPYLYTYV
ncbi:MAG: GH92 family glycosyl hydrolase, partial [Geminicoccaceae bacterium]